MATWGNRGINAAISPTLLRVTLNRARRNGKLASTWEFQEDGAEDKDMLTQESLSPIRINARDKPVTLTKLRVYRDIYYTQQAGATDFLPISFHWSAGLIFGSCASVTMAAFAASAP